MRFRPHAASDYPAIARLRWLLKSGDSDSIPNCDRADFVDSYLRHLADEDALGDTVHWLAEADGDPIAVMTVRTVRKEPSPGSGPARWGYLTNCYVEPAHRNRGIGTKLIGHVVDAARDAGMELLIVWPSERSIGFYRRAGFTGSEAPLELVMEDER